MGMKSIIPKIQLFLLLIIRVSMKSSDSANSLPEISWSMLMKEVAERELVCALFTGNQDSHSSAEKFFLHLKENLESKLDHGHFGKVTRKENAASSNDSPSLQPIIRCYSYWLEMQDFHGPFTTKALKEMTRKVVDSYNARIPLISTEEISSFLQQTEGLVMLIIIQDQAFSDILHENLKEIQNEFDSVQFYVHYFHGGGYRKKNQLIEELAVESMPSAILISGTDAHFVDRVEGPFRFAERIEGMLVTQTSVAEIISQDIFHAWLASEDPTSMYLLCLHAVWADHNLAYLKSFSATAKVLGAVQGNLKFGFVDVEKEREILTKHINPRLIKTFPCSLLLWKTEFFKGVEIHQALLPSRPTPWTISQFLESRDLVMVNREGDLVQYSPWEKEDNCQSLPGFTLYQPDCMSRTANESSVDHNVSGTGGRDISSVPDCDIGEQNREVQDVEETHVRDDSLKKLEINGIHQLTDDIWPHVIEQSDAPSASLRAATMNIPWDNGQPKTVLVVFIQHQCGSCENNMGLFRKISLNLENLGTGDFYIHNCSSDNLSCDRHHVRGFPTLLAFRNFGRLSMEKCTSDTSTQQYLRMDYHGVLNEKLIMEWYLEISTPTVQHATSGQMEGFKQVNDVSLSATLYPLSLAGKYLPTVAGPNSWFPYECFQLACDRLYGRARCYGTISENIQQRDLTMSHMAQDMVVTQVEMHRRDNISAVIFSLGKSLIATLQDEDNIELHRFHSPHRYDLKSGQRCEDSHSACTDVIVSFVQDHSRLPVTHITASAFHTHTSTNFAKGHSSSIFGADNLPVLLVLSTSDQLEGNTTLQQLLLETAYEFYDWIVFAALNVDEFPQWAARFVPTGYARHVVENDHAITEDNVPSLFIYPRICIVTEGSHNRAVFYPKYERFTLASLSKGRTITKSDLIMFISEFLSDPEKGLTQTELF